MRLDKLLADSGFGTRSVVRKKVLHGKVTVNGAVIRDASCKVAPGDEVTCYGEPVEVLSGKTYYYLLLDKPDEVLTAMEDPRLPCVGELIESRYKNRGVSPVGRLDYHTTGLLLLTNDGELSHRLTSPSYNVPKTYRVSWTGGPLTGKDVAKASEGITLTDTAAPEHLKPCEIILESEDTARLILREGKTHEVRRIMAHFGKEVVSLRRISLGSLSLDESSLPGDIRDLTKDEISALHNDVGILH
ncbi:MAG: rRNA pseudouridine synthase [Clostridiales bacterium]|nr:rRNA pseudouridine synthase [Clostridiales bacterium]